MIFSFNPDRTSTAMMRANQLRLWFSSVAYVLMNELQRLGLRATLLAEAQCQTIRLKLLKIGAQIKISVRRIFVLLASGYPYEAIFRKVHANLQRLSPQVGKSQVQTRNNVFGHLSFGPGDLLTC